MTHGEHLNTGVGMDVDGEMHDTDRYGMRFQAEESLRIERATIDAQSAGSVTFTLAEFSAGDGVGTVLDSRTYSVGEGFQEIRLGFEVDSPGEYLLYREESFPLRRIPSLSAFPLEYPFMTIVGGGRSTGHTNDYYYYFFDMEVAVESGGSGGGIGGDAGQKLDTIADPSSTTVVQTGSPSGGYHSNTGWGPVFDVTAPTHLRGGLVDADASEYAEFAVYKMDDDPLNVDSSSPYRTREVPVDPGEQYVQLEIYLEPGTYHFCQLSGTPMRRVDTATDWSSLNGADAPIDFVFGSWHYDRNPGHSSLSGGQVLDEIRAGNEDSILDGCNDDFAQIFESGWDSILHYLGDWDTGH